MPTPPEIEAREDPEKREQQEGELDYEVIGGENADAEADAEEAQHSQFREAASELWNNVVQKFRFDYFTEFK
ncbi:hypothetical protein FN846DRAFT_910980 [Sphaerosporella brunnea]|uniref:Uncharacterized protein n=1 Tax=Sphaerosporella brunnea TaxID=1250544 RepID=A0A5J5EMA2_9PEZI|nr:hypothetical protein FN846DRAFT_910980 [Sphaerosporella brunnea]